MSKHDDAESDEKTNLPLAFDTVVGAGTKRDQIYKVAPKNSVI